MKTCPKCRLEKPLSEFYKNGTKKDGLQTYCKDCLKKAVYGHYNRDSASKKKSVYDRRRRNYKEFLIYKATLSCKHCGFSDSRALEFHHRDPADKERNISGAVLQGWSLKRVMKEIEKCDVLCANCHAIEHAGVVE